MFYGSSYNYNMPSLMGGTGFMPSFGSGMGYSSFNSIFMTSCGQPDYKAMTGFAIAEGLMNLTTMCVTDAINDKKHKDNSVENTYEDIELLKEKKAAKVAEKLEVSKELEGLNDKTNSLDNNVKEIARNLKTARSGLTELQGAYDKAINDINASGADDAITKYDNQKELVEKLEKKHEEALNELEKHKAKVEELTTKEKELQTDINNLDNQIRTADEIADGQVLDKLLKRKRSNSYDTVESKFDSTDKTKLISNDVSPADAWAVVNAYRNPNNADTKEKYAKQFKAIYNALSPEEQADFHSIYRLMRDNHHELF